MDAPNPQALDFLKELSDRKLRHHSPFTKAERLQEFARLAEAAGAEWVIYTYPCPFTFSRTASRVVLTLNGSVLEGFSAGTFRRLRASRLLSRDRDVTSFTDLPARVFRHRSGVAEKARVA